MIIESYKVLEKEGIVPYGYCKHVVKTYGFVHIKYSLKQNLLNLLKLSDYSPVFFDYEIKQNVHYDITHGSLITSEYEKIDIEKFRQKKIVEELLLCREFKEWPEIEAKIRKYIINAGGSFKKSCIRGYEKRGS